MTVEERLRKDLYHFVGPNVKIVVNGNCENGVDPEGILRRVELKHSDGSIFMFDGDAWTWERR